MKYNINENCTRSFSYAYLNVQKNAATDLRILNIQRAVKMLSLKSKCRSEPEVLHQLSFETVHYLMSACYFSLLHGLKLQM